jgi:hypothetical protein
MSSRTPGGTRTPGSIPLVYKIQISELINSERTQAREPNEKIYRIEVQ